MTTQELINAELQRAHDSYFWACAGSCFDEFMKHIEPLYDAIVALAAGDDDIAAIHVDAWYEANKKGV